MEYKLITSIPLSDSLYELQKNTGASTYSIVYDLAEKLARMNIIQIEKGQSNGRRINRIRPGLAYAAFKAICDQFFQQYYSQATDLLKKEIQAIAQQENLAFQIIGGQLDPSRAYADIQIAIPENQSAKWKKAVKKMEKDLNFLGLTIEPKKQKRLFLRKLHIIPLPYRQINREIAEKLESQTLRDIHYGSKFPELEQYFLYLTAGPRLHG
ncbi:hypothetical protein HZC09_04135 [Candidatus Micrarchaeota archaeon]|nr:hypothetical protein [Candidatus Micrarchaeota archaeon]